MQLVNGKVDEAPKQQAKSSMFAGMAILLLTKVSKKVLFLKREGSVRLLVSEDFKNRSNAKGLAEEQCRKACNLII